MKARWVVVAGVVLGLTVLAQAHASSRRAARHQGAVAPGVQANAAGPRCRAIQGAGPGSAWEQLGLTEDQQARLAKLREANGGQVRQAMQDIRSRVQSGELTPEQARVEMEKLRAQHRQELAGILTAEQLQRLDEMRAAAGPGRWRERPGLGTGMGRPPWAGALGEALGLTEEQQAQLASLREKRREPMRQAMQDIRARVHRGELAPEQARAEIDKLREQRRQDLAGILTPEQLQKLDALRASRLPRGAAPAGDETAPASKPAGVQQESWGSIKYQSR